MQFRDSLRVALALTSVSCLMSSLTACVPTSSEEAHLDEDAPPEPISLTFERHSLERRSPDCEGTPNATPEGGPEGSLEGPATRCAEVSLAWVKLAEAPPGVARVAIHDWIQGTLLAPMGDRETPESPEALAESYLADFTDFQAEFPDGPGWFVERTIEPIHDDEQGVSFRFTDSSYLGGAHPNTYTLYTTLYLTTGRPVALEDLLLDGDPARLESLAEAHFRQVRELGPEEDLHAAGFWFESENGNDSGHEGSSGFELADSFALTDDGLLFHYNPYDIGPYALGGTTFTIPRSELIGVVAWPGYDVPNGSSAPDPRPAGLPGPPGAQPAL